MLNQQTVVDIILSHAAKAPDFEYYPDSDEGRPIIVADWNYVNSSLYNRLERVANEVGVELGWIDEYMPCEICDKACHTIPTHYGWQPDHVRQECGLVCKDCFIDSLREEGENSGFLEYYVGNSEAALPNWAKSHLEECCGYRCFKFDPDKDACENFESGFHWGQDDDPRQIAEELENEGYYDYIFVLNTVGQFDVSWTVLTYNPNKE